MKRLIKPILCVWLSLFVFVSSIYSVKVCAEGDSATDVSEVTYPSPPEITAKTGILIDADTGAILYDKDMHKKMYPASITKIMTALLTIENCALDDTFTFTDEIISTLPYDAAKYGYVSGEQVTIRDLLYVLMLRSANEAAIGLGMTIAGTEESFGGMMTERAKAAGALDTNFVNATGLHDDNHYTTAYDMAMIAKDAMKNTTFSQVWGTASYIVSPTNIEPDIVKIWNRHEMLVEMQANYYGYAEGGKTGYTDEAGRTLVTYASRNGMNLICVVMFSDSENVYKDTRALFEYGFNNFKKVSVNGNEKRFGQSDDGYFVSRSNMFNQSGSLLELGDDYVTIPKDASLSQIEYRLSYDKRDGQDENVIVGISYFMGEHYLGETTLKLSDNVPDDSKIGSYKTEQVNQVSVKEELPINIWWIVGAVITVLIIVFMLYYLRKTKAKRKLKRERKKLFKSKHFK